MRLSKISVPPVPERWRRGWSKETVRRGRVVLPIAMTLASCAIYGTSVAGWANGSLEEAGAVSTRHPGSLIYEANCAGCHGRALEGASATALVKSEWSYGRSRFAIGNNIRNGIPSAGMPAWGDILTEDEQNSLVEYILQTQAAKPLPPKALPNTIQTEDYRLKVDVIVDPQLSAPWGIAFIDARRALITDRSGKLFWMIDGAIDPNPIVGFPPVDRATSTGGLFDVEIDPDYEKNGWVYLAFAHSERATDAKSPGMTRVIRGHIEGHEWKRTQSLFRVPDSMHLPGSRHWGGRMLFDKSGSLYFSIGDMSAPKDSQDLSKPSGKLFRIRPDGTAAPGNPFGSADPIRGAIFSYGNRNIQGLAQHPATGAIWGSEHGPHGGDELNILRAGANYGWPIATYGVDYDGSTISEFTEKAGVEKPVRHWTPAPGISSLDFCGGCLFPKWQNNLFIGSLSHETLFRFVVDGERITREEIILKGYGRIREVKFGPDGSLYLALNNPGAIVRLTPML